jgi:hypothetical protein
MGPLRSVERLGRDSEADLSGQTFWVGDVTDIAQVASRSVM